MVVPITIQQAIDRGIVGHDPVRLGLVGSDGTHRRRRADRRRLRPAAGDRAPRRAQRARAVRPAGAADPPHPSPQPRRPQRGASGCPRRQGDERHRDARPVLPVGWSRLAARRHVDVDRRRRDARLRLDAGVGRVRRRAAARVRAPCGAAPPRRRLRPGAGTQLGDAELDQRGRVRRRDDPRLPRRWSLRGRGQPDGEAASRCPDPHERDRRVPVPVGRGVLGADGQRRRRGRGAGGARGAGSRRAR